MDVTLAATRKKKSSGCPRDASGTKAKNRMKGTVIASHKPE
jgi:hypothetical protein